MGLASPVPAWPPSVAGSRGVRAAAAPLYPIRYRGANGRWYDDEREARSVYSWDDTSGRERP
jgi:hypothetical protein